MKILILGGTGAMGIHLVKYLQTENFETYVTSRTPRESQGYTHYLCGNAHDVLFMQSILQEKWDAIVDFMVYSTADFENLYPLFLESTKQYVYLSSARVYANSVTPITEDSDRLLDVVNDPEYLNTDEYALTKARQENILIKSGKTNWTIIRPYITYSENRLQLGTLEKEEWLYRALHGRTIVFSSEIALRLTTMTYGADVANVIFKSIGCSNALGTTFQIVNNQSILWSEVLEIYLDALKNKLGYKPKVLLTDLNTFQTIRSQKYQVIYDRLFDRVFDNSKIIRTFSSIEFKDISNQLKICLDHFFQNQSFAYINWQSEAIKDRLTGEWTSPLEIKSTKSFLKYLYYRIFNF